MSQGPAGEELQVGEFGFARFGRAVDCGIKVWEGGDEVLVLPDFPLSVATCLAVLSAHRQGLYTGTSRGEVSKTAEIKKALGLT